MDIKHTLTFYKNTNIFPSSFYKIDSIDEYLEQFEKKEIEYRDFELRETETIAVVDDFSLVKDEHFLQYNYVKSVNYIEKNGVKKIIEEGYYFATSFLRETTPKDDGTYIVHINLLLDVINTFLDRLVFTNKTLVFREHKDRFKFYSLFNGQYYFFRNFPEISTGEKASLNKIYTFKLFPEVNRQQLWLKLIFRDELNDLLTLFIPYYQNALEITAFHKYARAQISGILNDARVVSCSLIPYQPCLDNQTNFFKKTIQFKTLAAIEPPQVVEYNVDFLATFFIDNEAEISQNNYYLTKVDNISPIAISTANIENLSTLLEKFLICRVPQADIEEYKNNIHINGLFKKGDEVWDVNEPAVLSSNYVKKTITFSNGFIYDFYIENIIPSNDFFNNFVPNVDNQFLTISFKNRLSEQGYFMTIGNGSLCEFDEQKINLDFVSDLPLFNSQYRDYVISGQYTRDKQAIQEKYDLEKRQLALERQNQLRSAIGATLRFGTQFAAAMTAGYLGATASTGFWDAVNFAAADAEERETRELWFSLSPKQRRKGVFEKIAREHFRKRVFNYGDGKSYTSSGMIRDAARTFGAHEGYGRQKWVREGFAFSAFRTADFISKWVDFLVFNVERQKLPMLEENRIAALSDLKVKKDLKILNGLGISSSTSFEDIVYQQEKFGVHFTIECLDKENQDEAEKIYYLFGYECKERKIPLHHNRMLFDYLQCDPDFQNYRSVLKNEVFFNMIRELLKTGIFFIHKVYVHGKKEWHFETENLENLEYNIIDANR